MTSTDPTTPNPPDFVALLANLASHREQAQDKLWQAEPVTHQGGLIQGAIAHAMTGILLVAEAMIAERVAELAGAAAERPTEPVGDAAPRDGITARVRVFHNNEVPDSFLRGYETGQTVTEVFAYDEANFDPAIHDDLGLAEYAFELLNIGHDPDSGFPDPRAVDYRSRGNRSLSVGDVLAINDRFLSCDRIGFRELDKPPAIHQIRQHGTAPLYH